LFFFQNLYDINVFREQGKVMMKVRDPQMMANIWSSGKIVCQGAKSENDAKRGSRKYVPKNSFI